MSDVMGCVCEGAEGGREGKEPVSLGVVCDAWKSLGWPGLSVGLLGHGRTQHHRAGQTQVAIEGRARQHATLLAGKGGSASHTDGSLLGS